MGQKPETSAIPPKLAPKRPLAYTYHPYASRWITGGIPVGPYLAAAPRAFRSVRPPKPIRLPLPAPFPPSGTLCKFAVRVTSLRHRFVIFLSLFIIGLKKLFVNPDSLQRTFFSARNALPPFRASVFSSALSAFLPSSPAPDPPLPPAPGCESPRSHIFPFHGR